MLTNNDMAIFRFHKERTVWQNRMCQKCVRMQNTDGDRLTSETTVRQSQKKIPVYTLLLLLYLIWEALTFMTSGVNPGVCVFLSQSCWSVDIILLLPLAWQDGKVKPQPRQSKAICLVVGRKSVSHLVNSEEQYASHPLMSFAITVPILLLCLCHLNRIPNSTVNFSSLLCPLFLCYFFEEVQHRRRYIV